MKSALIALFLAIGAPAFCQNPQTQTVSTSAVNSQWTNGVAPGYRPTDGGGLVLDLGPGESICAGTPTPYAGGTVTLTSNSLNYVYVDGSTCLPTSSTSSLPASAKPIATVTTNWNSIHAIDDLRTVFGVSGGGATWPLTSPSGATIGSNNGDLEFTASGTNQNITITPSGTGHISLKPAAPVNQTLLDLYEDNSATIAYLSILNSAGTSTVAQIKWAGSATKLDNNNAAGTSINLTQASNAPHFGFVQGGYLPTLTGCGTGAAVTAGSGDNNGSMTVGTSPGSCVISFRGTFGGAPVAPICVDVTAKTVIGCTASTTQLTLGTVTASDVINWWLTGN